MTTIHGILPVLLQLLEGLSMPINKRIEYQFQGLLMRHFFLFYIQLLVKENIVAYSSRSTGFFFSPNIVQQEQQQQQQSYILHHGISDSGNIHTPYCHCCSTGMHSWREDSPKTRQKEYTRISSAVGGGVFAIGAGLLGGDSLGEGAAPGGNQDTKS